LTDARAIANTPGGGKAIPAPQIARAAAISQSLREAARKAHRTNGSWLQVASTGRRWDRALIPGIIVGFLVIVVLPVLLSGFYLLFIASDQYSSEIRFAVRGGEPTVLEPIGTMRVASAQRIQDTLIVYNYIQSRGIVEDIDKVADLRKIYSRSEADYFWRFNPKLPIEELVKYWWKRVTVDIDQMSGIITVIVTAFTPEDALAVAKGIVSSSERLVNDLSERARKGALSQAQAELNLAQANMQDKIRSMRDLRNTERVVDAGKQAEALNKMHAELQLDLIRMEQEYIVQRRTVAASAPQLQVLQSRITSLRDQLKQLAAQVTTVSGGSTNPALSESMGRFDLQKLELTVAESAYQMAMGNFERARLAITAQQLYLAPFQPPVLAEHPLYPKRLWIWSVIFAISLAVWGAGVGLTILVRNHVAI
jgi:capsular polysaccharide transport system permease protein